MTPSAEFELCKALGVDHLKVTQIEVRVGVAQPAHAKVTYLVDDEQLEQANRVLAELELVEKVDEPSELEAFEEIREAENPADGTVDL